MDAAVDVRAERRAVVDHRVDEELEDDGHAAVVREEREPRREPAAGARPADGDARGVHAEGGRLAVEPGERGEAVLERRGERVLGGEAVVDRRDHAAERLRVGGAEGVVLLGGADEEAPAVHPEERGRGRRQALGAVDAHPHRRGPLGAGRRRVLDADPRGDAAAREAAEEAHEPEAPRPQDAAGEEAREARELGMEAAAVLAHGHLAAPVSDRGPDALPNAAPRRANPAAGLRIGARRCAERRGM